MKKLLSMILVCSMIFSMAVPAFAATNNENDNGYNIEESVPYLDELSSKQYLYSTEVENIKKSADGSYAMVSATDNGTISIPVGRLDINLSDSEQYLSALSNNNISDPVKDELRRLHELTLSSDCETPVVSLFSPQLLYSSINNQRQIIYDEYNGYSIREEVLVTTNIKTPWEDVTKGEITEDTISDAFSIIVSCLGFAPKYIGITAGGISLAQAFINAFGEDWMTGSTSGYVQVRITYSKTEQWTWVNCDGDWALGLFTQKATVSKVESSTYIFNADKREGRTNEAVDYSTQGPYVSPHFEPRNTRYATAIQNRYSSLNESLAVYFFDKKLYI